MRHICPTAPDTLRSFPFVESDPFIIEKAPHVYFAGNQKKYESEKIIDNVGSVCHLLSIPSFRQTGTFVLLDLKTLESYPYTFKVDQLVEGTGTSGTEETD